MAPSWSIYTRSYMDVFITLLILRQMQKDVLDLLRDLGTTFIRYPGGNFVSGYHWKDGIGPRDKRIRKYDLAWEQEESNQVGIDEFCTLCRQLNIEPMLVLNLGTGTSEEALEELEYCNYDGNTKWAVERRKNGKLFLEYRDSCKEKEVIYSCDL